MKRASFFWGVFLLLGFSAAGQTNEWTKPTSGSWEELYWSLGQLPGINQQLVEIDNYGWKAVAIGANTSANFPQSLSLNNLRIDGPTNSMNTLLLNWAQLSVPLNVYSNLIVGTNGSLVSHYSAIQAANAYIDGSASFMDYATENFGQLTLRSGGTLGLTNGIVTTSNLTFYTGKFTQSGGTHTVQSINNVAGDYNNFRLEGEYDLLGGTLISAGVSLGSGGGYNPEGHGSIHQTGGIHTNRSMILWGWSHHWSTIILGSYSLDGGLLVSDSVWVDGGFSQTGGTNRIQELHVESAFSLTGGELVTSNVSVHVNPEVGALGFYQTGGVHVIEGQLLIDSPLDPYYTRSYEIAGGSLAVSNLNITSGEFLLRSNASLAAWNIEIEPYGMLHLAGGIFTNQLLTLAGGTFSASASPSYQLGTIQLSGGGALDFGGTLRFQDSHDVNWAGTLNIMYWSTNNQGIADHIFIGSSAQGLTADQLRRVIFVRPNGVTSDYSAGMLPTGELVPGSLYDYTKLIYDYVITNGTVTITGCHGSNTVAVIPKTIDGLPVTALGEGVFQSWTMLKSISLPNSLISIGDSAFNSCDNLLTMDIGTNVVTIGNGAFSGCDSLTNIAIPNSVTNIGNGAFASCYRLTNVDLGYGVKSIGDDAFIECTGLTSITIPNSTTNIGSEAFAYCNNLTNVDLGSSVKTIGDDAFTYCRLTRLKIPDSVIAIGQEAFKYCRSLTNITLGNGPLTIGTYAFSLCNGLTVVDMGSGVTSIGDYAFYSCGNLTNIVIPRSVTNIGQHVFDECIDLIAITVDPNNSFYSSVIGILFNKSRTLLIQWPEGKAGWCTIPSTVIAIGNYAFYFSQGLTGVTIPNNVTTIGEGAFQACASLTNMTIPNSVTNIGFNAFSYCFNLSAVFFTGDAPNVGWDAFESSGPTVYYLPGTSGWSATFADRPTALWLPSIDTNPLTFGIRTNRFGFSLTWASGRTVVIEARTNLVKGTWFPIATNSFTNGLSYFSDPRWTNDPVRFYRLRWP